MRRVLPLLLLPLLLTSCSSGDPSGSTPEIVVGSYPFQWLAEQVGGSSVEVTNLVKPGVEPHDAELTPRQVAKAEQAALVLTLKGFQPALDAIDDSTDLSAARGLDLIAGDPHVWLDPVRMKAMAGYLTETLISVGVGSDDDPGPRQRLAELDKQLDQLDNDIRARLKDCRTREFVTSHEAFGYFAQRYGLVQRGISGLDPHAEPSPAKLAEVIRFARANKVKTIFFETLVDPSVAKTVASEVGAKTAVLDPIESVEGFDDYPTVMRRNAEALHDALGCA